MSSFHCCDHGKIDLLTPDRIEDNVLVTKSGHENLTTAVKEAAEMESIITSAN